MNLWLLESLFPLDSKVKTKPKTYLFDSSGNIAGDISDQTGTVIDYDFDQRNKKFYIVIKIGKVSYEVLPSEVKLI
jgi:hypothetical protein